MGPAAACDLIFLDPPYRADLAAPALDTLRDAGWIESGSICVVETGSNEDTDIPDRFEILDERKYGAAQIHLLRCE